MLVGKIRAIQLDYTESHKHLMQAIRKAPHAPMAAGFQQAVLFRFSFLGAASFSSCPFPFLFRAIKVHKLSVIVQLLLGEIPERSTFRQPVLKKPLLPYLHITQGKRFFCCRLFFRLRAASKLFSPFLFKAVRIGDLLAFQKAMQEHGAQFQKDKTYTLILRLRHNVIKTGIRMVSLSYSRIPLKDLCQKLHLETEEDVEFIVAKVCSALFLSFFLFHPFSHLLFFIYFFYSLKQAIRDGVIDASLDHQAKFMKSKANSLKFYFHIFFFYSFFNNVSSFFFHHPRKSSTSTPPMNLRSPFTRESAFA